MTAASDRLAPGHSVTTRHGMKVRPTRASDLVAGDRVLSGKGTVNTVSDVFTSLGHTRLVIGDEPRVWVRSKAVAFVVIGDQS